MARYRLHNLATGRRFEFTDDAEPLAQRLARKVAIYGTPEQHTVAVVDETPDRISAAWKTADAFAEAGFDLNSRSSLLWLAADPACPEWRKTRIAAVQSWWAAVWAHYADVKARILAGEDAKFDPAIPGACPFTIWQITTE